MCTVGGALALVTVAIGSSVAVDFFVLPHDIQPHIVQALVDNTLHAGVACCTWCAALIMWRNSAVKWHDVAFGLAAGSLVDVDHFIAAGKLSLHGATHLHSRRWLLGHSPLFMGLAALVLGPSTFCGIPVCFTKSGGGGGSSGWRIRAAVPFRAGEHLRGAGKGHDAHTAHLWTRCGGVLACPLALR